MDVTQMNALLFYQRERKSLRRENVQRSRQKSKIGARFEWCHRGTCNLYTIRLWPDVAVASAATLLPIRAWSTSATQRYIV
jgi:hypothetical protein